MTRYRTLALQVVYADAEADSPEQADMVFRTYSPDNFEHEAWIATVLLVETEPGSDEFDVVHEWTQPDLWTSVLLNANAPTRMEEPQRAQ